MPVYTLANRGASNAASNQKIADAIADIHCDTTGAPPEFVNVLFMDNHPLKGGATLSVTGNVRSGGNRNQELTNTLRENLRNGIAHAAGLPNSKVTIELIGFPASWGMEGGEILPEPGEEAEWLNRS